MVVAEMGNPSCRSCAEAMQKLSRSVLKMHELLRHACSSATLHLHLDVAV